MNEVVVARHGESEASAQRIVGGDSRLTEKGREQALALGERLRAFPVDLCLTSPALRARETAELALRGLGVEMTIVGDLGDIDFGDFEGRTLEEYRRWVQAHSPRERPPGGESRVDTLRRFARAFRAVLGCRERHVLVVAHGLTVRALLDERPQPVVSNAAYAAPVWLQADELERAVDRLDRWCESPSW